MNSVAISIRIGLGHNRPIFEQEGNHCPAEQQGLNGGRRFIYRPGGTERKVDDCVLAIHSTGSYHRVKPHADVPK